MGHDRQMFGAFSCSVKPQPRLLATMGSYKVLPTSCYHPRTRATAIGSGLGFPPLSTRWRRFT